MKVRSQPESDSFTAGKIEAPVVRNKRVGLSDSIKSLNLCPRHWYRRLDWLMLS